MSDQNSSNDERISPLKAMGFSSLGFLTAYSGAVFASAISQGYADAAVVTGAITGGLLYLSHGPHDYMQDDKNATGLKNHFLAYALGASLIINAPSEDQQLNENQTEEFGFVIENQEEMPRYPALENVSFG